MTMTITPERRAVALSYLDEMEKRVDRWPDLHANQYDASDIWGPPHPSEASMWNRRVPLFAVGLAFSVSCGALAIVIALTLVRT